MSLSIVKSYTASKKNMRDSLKQVHTEKGVSFASDGHKAIIMNIGQPDNIVEHFPDIKDLAAYKYRPNLSVEIDYNVFMRGYKLANVFDNIYIGINQNTVGIIGRSDEQGNCETLLETKVLHDNSIRRQCSQYKIPKFKIPKCKTLTIHWFDETPQIKITGNEFTILLVGTDNRNYFNDLNQGIMTPFKAKSKGVRGKSGKPLFKRKLETEKDMLKDAVQRTSMRLIGAGRQKVEETRTLPYILEDLRGTRKFD